MSRLDLELIGAEEVEADLRDLAERVTDARPAMRKVRDIMREGLKRNFETSGAYLGDSWQPLSPATLARKARKGRGAKALVAEGGLERALLGGKGKKSRATKTTAAAGISIWYSIFAQSGAKGNRKGEEPARKIIGMTPRDWRKSERVVEKYLETGQVFP